MTTILTLIEGKIELLDFLENDLQVQCALIKDDRLCLEQEIETCENNGDYNEAEKCYNDLDLLVYPVRKIEAEIRQVKKSIIEDYCELIHVTTGDVSLTNSINKAKRNYVQSERIIKALRRKFNK